MSLLVTPANQGPLRFVEANGTSQPPGSRTSAFGGGEIVVAEAFNQQRAGSDRASITKVWAASRWLSAVVMVVSLVALGKIHAGDRDTKPKTYTYKTVGTLPIKADVYRLPGDDVRPVIVWMHGGALISGGPRSSQVSSMMVGMPSSGFVSKDPNDTRSTRSVLPSSAIPPAAILR